MNNKSLAAHLAKMGLDEDNYEREDRLVMLRAARLLDQSVRDVIVSSYKAGFCDAVAKGTQGTNIHITANRNAEAYALALMKGSRDI